MPSWIQQAAHRGILTSRYPRVAASEPDEIPLTARGPLPTGPIGPAAVDGCPVGAISPSGVDQGRCVRCARCLATGFRFGAPIEMAGTSPASLRTSTVAPAPSGAGSLAELGRSLHVFLVDVGSCNACNLEVLALANPFYDVSRLGIFFTNSPRHADVLLVVGVPTAAMIEPVRRAYEAIPAPKAVVAIGACPISGGVFRGQPGLRSSLDELVPVDLFVPGCPPAPTQILDALLTLAGRGRREG